MILKVKNLNKRIVLGFRHFVPVPRELICQMTDARRDKSPGGRFIKTSKKK